MKKISFVLTFLWLNLLFPLQLQAQIRNWDDPDGNPATADSCLVDGVPTLTCLEVVAGNLLFMSNAFIVLVLFIMFVIGGFRYLTSLGNPEKVEGAQGTFKWAIIGTGLYVSSYLILNIIDILFLGGDGTIFQFNLGGNLPTPTP